MSTTKMRSDLADWLVDLDDDFLAAVYAMVGTYRIRQRIGGDSGDDIVSFDAATGSPLTSSEFTKVLDEAQAAVQRGEYITFEEHRKASAKWGRPTK